METIVEKPKIWCDCCRIRVHIWTFHHSRKENRVASNTTKPPIVTSKCDVLAICSMYSMSNMKRPLLCIVCLEKTHFPIKMSLILYQKTVYSYNVAKMIKSISSVSFCENDQKGQGMWRHTRYKACHQWSKQTTKDPVVALIVQAGNCTT